MNDQDLNDKLASDKVVEGILADIRHTCLWCGELFTPASLGQIYCSDKCALARCGFGD